MPQQLFPPPYSPPNTYPETDQGPQPRIGPPQPPVNTADIQQPTLPETTAQIMSGPNNTQAPGLLVPGTITNLYNRPATKNTGGGWSTTYSKSFKFPEGEVLVPTVINGKF